GADARGVPRRALLLGVRLPPARARVTAAAPETFSQYRNQTGGEAHAQLETTDPGSSWAAGRADLAPRPHAGLDHLARSGCCRASRVAHNEHRPHIDARLLGRLRDPCRGRARYGALAAAGRLDEVGE